MDTKIRTIHKVDLERMVLDESAEPTYLPLSLLQEITDSFSDDQQIGSGGSAIVYKGTVGKGMVAVKKLSITIDMHENNFHKEVECLMKAKHKNIVRFLGYCSDTQGMVGDYDGKFVMADVRNWVLCFEYIPNGSLDKYITGTQMWNPFPPQMRLVDLNGEIVIVLSREPVRAYFIFMRTVFFI
uniref:Protein kinase domain-containing protein n=2 Tax=Aegilops tauschii subsp. strangulata TaxID=200361 RepID=A0A453MUU0_AEGTS